MFFDLGNVNIQWKWEALDNKTLKREKAILMSFSNSPDKLRLVVQTGSGPYIYVGQYSLTNAKDDLFDMLRNSTIEMCPQVRVTAVELLTA
jgi:hypothetical protein